MPGQRKGSSATVTHVSGLDVDVLKVAFAEILSDHDVLKALKKSLYPQELSDKLDLLTAKIEQLYKETEQKENRITDLEKRVVSLELQNDRLEQYSRRANLRFEGISEAVGTPELEKELLRILNDNMKLIPKMQTEEIERAHRIGRLIPEGRPRTVIVRFKSERRRDAVFKTRANLKTHNATTETHRIFVNEDLTNQRAGLLFELRKLKKAGNIADCWSFNGNILMKTLNMKVRQVQTRQDQCFAASATVV